MVATEKIYAVPASPRVHILTQASGSTIQARQWGDELLHGVETVDGYTIVFDEATQNWMYAIHDVEGKLVPSSNIVGKDSPPTGVKPSLRPIKPQIANSSPTFRDSILILPSVDLPQRGGAYQNVRFKLTSVGEWQLLDFLITKELQHIDKVEIIKTDSFRGSRFSEKNGNLESYPSFLESHRSFYIRLPRDGSNKFQIIGEEI
jgi:hypothetical protein